MILADPPYGIGFDGDLQKMYARKKDKVITSYQEVSQTNYKDFSRNWIQECYRVLKKDGTIYIASGFQNLEHILAALRECGFHLVNFITWTYQFPVWTKNKWVQNCIPIIFASKTKKFNFYPEVKFKLNERSNDGLKNLNYFDRHTSWVINREWWRNKNSTVTKLPYDLVTKIISYTSTENNLILDPFLGSGQSLFAAKEMNRSYIGFEIDKATYDLAKKRIDTLIY